MNSFSADRWPDEARWYRGQQTRAMGKPDHLPPVRVVTSPCAGFAGPSGSAFLFLLIEWFA